MMARGKGYFDEIVLAGLNLTQGQDYWGNTVFVDSINGSDATGARNGPPFLTVQAALAVAVSGDTVVVLPGTYNLTSGLVMVAGVAMRGLTHNTTILQMLGVVAPVTLVTMAEDTELQSITFRATSAAHVAITGVLFPALTGGTAHLYDCDVEIDNSGAGVGSSDVIGVRATGTASPLGDVFPLTSSRVIVRSVSAGKKRGVLVDTAAHIFSVLETILYITGGTDAIGAEVNFAGATLRIEGGQCFGDAADVSQTLGTLTIGATILDHHSANGRSFATSQYGALQCFGDDGALVNGTRYMYPGTATGSTNEVFIRIPQACLVLSLSLRARIAPGGVDSCTVTVRKNGVATALTVTITGATLAAVTDNLSVAFAAGDDLSVQVVDAGSTQDVMVVLSFY